MPKLKTRKAVAKRVKITGTGKVRRQRANARHILTKKSSKRKRRLRQDAPASPGDTRRVKACLPYGL
jgi:large subunit ribosomal protein L35